MDSRDEAALETTPDFNVERRRHSPATLERWFRTTPAILHSIDSAGRLIEVSDAWLAKFGYLREEVIGRPSTDFLTVESRAYAIREVVAEFYRTGRRDNIEYQMVCKDGSVLDVLLSAVLDPGEADQGSCSLAVITDVTTLRQAERKLAESEALYKGLIESQSDLVSLATPEGELRFVNMAYAKVHDRQPHELVGINMLNHVPAEFRDSVAQQLRLVCASKSSVESENQVVSADGTTRWMAWTNRAITDAEGHVIAIHSIGHDIERRVVAEERLRASEARYRLLAENSSDMVMLVRSNGQRIYVSPACRKLLGWSPEEMMQVTARESMHPEDFAKWQHLLTDFHNPCPTLTYRLQHKDGTFVWVETSSQPVVIVGEVPQRLVVVRDIRQRVEAENRIKQSETRYRMLAENSSDMVILVRRDGRREYVSPVCQKLLGWSPEEMLGMTTMDALHPEDLPTVLRVLAEDDVEQDMLTYRMRRKDGAYIWVEAAMQRVEIAGEASQRVLLVRDVERRVQAELRLKESEASYRLLADNSSDMVFQLDLDLVRRYVSPASLEILGYEPSELIGRTPVERCHPDDFEAVSAAFRSLLTGETERQTLINRRLHRDGCWIWVEAQLKALRDPLSGDVCGIVGGLRDISQRKAVEDELAEANRRLEILATRDALTGLANRRAFDEALAREHLHAGHNQLALIMIDVDRFKSFNDRYGHPVGDRCLVQVAQAIAGAVRHTTDLAARYGGEEFVVLLPNTDEYVAAKIGERIRLAVRSLALENEAGVDRIVTISAGFAATLNLGDVGVEKLLRDADAALYRAKNAGRDRVVNAARPQDFDALSTRKPERQWI